jgi:hypothetical protein
MNTTGFDNTATGFSALRNNTTGSGNTATGANALQNDTYGIENSAFGKHALFFNNVGSHNTAVGFEALDRNVTGDDNTAAGAGALRGNSTGFENTANGAGALYRNTTGISNTATGASALFYNIADYNTANGDEALFSNTTGIFNTACGWFALHTNTTGSGNTATGSGALRENRTGSSNIALGNGAGSNLTAGDDNIYVGSVGPSSFGSEANTIRIGNEAVQAATYIAGINGRTASGGVAVYVNTDGKLGTAPSSARFKDEIRPMVSASEAILALKPVTFRYKAEIDPKGIPQFGLVAEEVEKVNPALIVRDKEGKPYSVRYEQINAMLLNEFLKEHRKVQELEANAVRQQKQIETLTAGLRKVSAQLELNQPVPQTVCLPAIVLREGENDR